MCHVGSLVGGAMSVFGMDIIQNRRFVSFACTSAVGDGGGGDGGGGGSGSQQIFDSRSRGRYSLTSPRAWNRALKLAIGLVMIVGGLVTISFSYVKSCDLLLRSITPKNYTTAGFFRSVAVCLVSTADALEPRIIENKKK